MKNNNFLKYIIFFLFGLSTMQTLAQTNLAIQQKTLYSEFGQRWIAYVYLDNYGDQTITFPYAFAVGATFESVSNQKTILVNALKKNDFGNISHNTWKNTDNCSKALFAVPDGANRYVILAAKVANTGNDTIDYFVTIYDWFANSNGVFDGAIMIDRKIVKDSSDKLRVTAFLNCPNNQFIAWFQNQNGNNTTLKRKITSSNDNHFILSGIDQDVNVYIGCTDFSQANYLPVTYSPLTPLTLSTTESLCSGTNRTVTISPSGGAGKYEFFVDGVNKSDTNTSPSDGNHCNGMPDNLFYGTSLPGKSTISLAGGQEYTFYIRDAYQSVPFSVSVSACKEVACGINFDISSVATTTCNNTTTFTIQAKTADNVPFNAQFSIDNINWYNSNSETNQIKFTFPQANECRTFWAKPIGCNDSTKVKKICLQDTNASYPENCSATCDNNLSLIAGTVTTCENQATFTIKAKDENNLPFLAQFSLDKLNWYNANIGTNQFKFTLTQNNTCRNFWVKPSGCTDPSKLVKGCYLDTDKNYLKNCSNTCDVNVDWDTSSITICKNLTTFILKAKESNNLPFAAQFSLDNNNWYDATAETNKIKFTLSQNNTCHNFWLRPKGCTNTAKVKTKCFADTNPTYLENCSNSCEVNLDWDTGSAATCGNLATFIIKAKEVNNLPFIAQFSLDKINWFNANIGMNQFKFTVIKNNTCRPFWVRPADCTDDNKIRKGCYLDTFTGNEDCTTTGQDIIKQFYLLGNEQENLPFKVVIAPNPVHDILTTQINLLKEIPVKISCFSTLGNLLFTKEIKGEIGKNIVQFDMITYQAGIYLLAVEADNKQITKKIIKLN